MSAAAHPIPAASRHAVAWDAVRERGGVEEDRRRGGEVRYRLVFYFGRKRVRIYGRPSPLGGIRPFDSRREAEQTLQEIRGEAVSRDWPLERVLGLWRPQAAPQDLVEVRLEEHLAHWRALVAAGHRSRRSLTELERYAAPRGHLSWWFGRSVHGITYGDVESWHAWLAARRKPSGEPLGPKTQKNVSDAFRAFLQRLRRREEIERVPDFPPIAVPEHAPEVLSLDQLEAVLAEFPWERRGAFLAHAYEALRVSEVRALDVEDFREGRLRVVDALAASTADAPRRGRTKTGAAEWREPWHPELCAWLAWRLDQAREARLQGRAVALFWNPEARNAACRWSYWTMRDQWRAASTRAGVPVVPLGEGTRHTVLTALGAELPERMLRAFSRHREGRSLSRYSKPQVTRAAMLRRWPKGVGGG